MADTPVVFLHGARQTGKTTLAKALVDDDFPATYLTLDNASLLAAASQDPEGFIAGLDTPAILDEVQLVPELFRAIKAEVDRDRRPGRFLLTGSAHLLVLPRLADSLAGRMEALALWPLSQGEIEDVEESAIDRLFDDAPLPAGDLPAPDIDTADIDLPARVARGGFPEVLSRPSAARRRAWFESYLTTILQRDVRDLSNIAGLADLPKLMRLLAARATTLLNASQLSQASGIATSTLKRYLGLLEGTFLIERIPAWSSNLSKRLVRSPKIVLLDSGLLCHLQGLDADALRQDPDRFGPILENFVIREISKQVGWSETAPRLYHYRTHGKQEVDILLEDSAGRIVAVEVKSRATIRARDFAAMRDLQDALGERFHRGVVLHSGRSGVPFGERLHALPIPWLWREPG